MHQDPISVKKPNYTAPHTPVMLETVISLLQPKDGGSYIDGTFGAGGHTKALLASCKCRVHAIDRDVSTIDYTTDLQEIYNSEETSHFFYYNCLFSQMSEVLPSGSYDGILMDLGVSSMQLDQVQRGFSFLKDGPLAMGMGFNNLTAEEVVNYYNEEQLEKIILEYGEERNARKIAKAIGQARRFTKITSTSELADIIHKAVGTKRYGKIDSATQTFQALRIEVNNELVELEKGLQVATDMLNVGGTMVIICFQGLETRVVKRFTRDLIRLSGSKSKYKLENKEESLRVTQELELQEQKHKPTFLNLTPHAIKPLRSEVLANSRARSALIRAIRRVA